MIFKLDTIRKLLMLEMGVEDGEEEKEIPNMVSNYEYTRVFLQNIIRCCRKAAASIFCKPIIFDDERRTREEKTKDVQVEEKKNKTTRPKLWVFCFVIFIFFSSTLTIIMIYNTAKQRLDR